MSTNSEPKQKLPANRAGSSIILFAHGSRDPEWAMPFHSIQRLIALQRPELAVELAFLEFAEPSLEQTIERLARAGHRVITIAPLFMAQGGHLRNDLPRIIEAIRSDHPGVEIEVLPPIGEVPAILDEISKWIVSAAATRNV